MDPNLARLVNATALLLFVALPVTTLAGGALFMPWRRQYWSLGHIRSMLRAHGWVLGGLVAMLLPIWAESQVDPIVDSWTGLDFTPALLALEGGFHAWLQSSLGGVEWLLQPVLAASYVAGYPVLIILTPVLGIWLGRPLLARRALAAYALCFAVAVPFFLFMPVDEVWFAHNTCPPGDPSAFLQACNQGAVRNLVLEYDFVSIYAYNEINNCFPSLHTAMSVALAAVAWRSGAPRRYAWFAAVLAGVIVASTVYLGIHWVSDVVAGLAVAWGVVFAVERWIPDRRPTPPTTPPAASPVPPPRAVRE